MTVSVFVTLLTVFSTVTSIATEAVKKLAGDNVSANMSACVCGGVVGVGGTAVYYILKAVEFSAGNITLMILMGLASAMGAMVGYDKVKQMIEQLG